MIIETKYNINDYLWFIHRGKPCWEQVLNKDSLILKTLNNEKDIYNI